MHTRQNSPCADTLLYHRHMAQSILGMAMQFGCALCVRMLVSATGALLAPLLAVARLC